MLRLHRAHILGRHQGQEGREGDVGRICRQDNPVTRNPVHTVECTLPEKARAPEKCPGVDGPKTALTQQRSQKQTPHSMATLNTMSRQGGSKAMEEEYSLSLDVGTISGDSPFFVG